MKVDQKGSASVDLVVVTAVIVIFLLMPLLATLIEKIVVVHTLNRVVDAMEGTLYAMTESLSLEALAIGDVAYDIESLQMAFESDFSTDVGKLVEVEIIDLEFYSAGSQVLVNGSKRKVLYDTLHVDLEIVYEHVFYGALLNKDYREKILFRYDLEIPQNR